MKTVTLLMALYHPNPDWLAQQLASLEAQTYLPLELLIVDDGPDEPVDEAFLQEHLHRIPYRLERHTENRGSNATYAELVGKAQGEYIAFCDQDDRWKPEKIATLVTALETQKAQAAYCTLCVIDGAGAPVADDVRSVRQGDFFLEGEDVADRLLIKNCIYGCSVLLRRKTAQAALPLPAGMGFDHWFTLWAALCGRIVFVEKPLVEYRVHGGNQSQPLRGITTKAEYEEQRIGLSERLTAAYLPRLWAFPQPERAAKTVEKAQAAQDWVRARRRWLHHDFRALGTFIRGRHLSPRAFWFELALPFLPPVLAGRLFRKIAK